MEDALIAVMKYLFLGIFSFIPGAAKWVLDGLLFVLGKAFYILFDGLLTCVSAVFTALDFSSFVAGYAMSWAGLPDQFIWMINQVSIPAGITMLTAAIGLRMAINLIPAAFTRI